MCQYFNPFFTKCNDHTKTSTQLATHSPTFASVSGQSNDLLLLKFTFTKPSTDSIKKMINGVMCIRIPMLMPALPDAKDTEGR